jgi:hypothetical protein
MGGIPGTRAPQEEQNRAAGGRAFPQLLQKEDIGQSPTGLMPVY